MSNNLIPLKKPLNALDNPVYADIRGPPPRFYDSGKHWTVDVGQTPKQVEFEPGYQDYAVLAQSRSYNTDIYGKSSSRDVVNKAFRPPLITQEDILPLNRLPRELVIPTTNPWTNEYQLMPDETALMTRFTSVDKQHYTTDRIKHGYTFPSYYRPVHVKGGIGGVVGVLPDLKVKLPHTSTYAYANAPKGINMDNPGQKENYSNITAKLRSDDKITKKSAKSSTKNPYRHSSLRDFEMIEPDLKQKHEYCSVSSGINKRMNNIQNLDGYHNLELEEKNVIKNLNTGAFKKMNDGPTVVDLNLEQKNTIRGIRPNKSVKMDTLDRSIFSNIDGNKKLEKDIPRAPMQTYSKQIFKTSNNYKKPDFKQKEAFLQGGSYHTKGFVPRFGPSFKDQIGVSMKK